MIPIESQLLFIQENFDTIFSNLKKFDMFKRSKAKNAPLIPTFMQKGMKLLMIVNQQEMRSYCSDISGLIQFYLLKELSVESKVVYGEYTGTRKRFSEARWGKHAWVELSDGTIVDGSYIQFQPKSTKNPKLLKIIRPSDSEYNNYKKSDYEESELKPLPYIIEAYSKKYSQTQADKENANWRGSSPKFQNVK